MKKIMLIVCVLAGMGLSQKPLEARGGIGVVFGQPSGITFRIDRFPVVTIGYSFLYGNPWINGSLDFWILNNPIQGQFRWYLGLGGNLGLYANSENPVRLGARVPVGVQWVPLDTIEVFLEAAPGILLFPSVGFDIQAGLGIRFMIFR